MGIIWVIALPPSIALIIITIIREKAKERRIKLLKDVDNSKIETLGNYEQKSRFKERLEYNQIYKLLNFKESKEDES
ncbi:hypothetical protein [Maribacter aquivivus]|jgi:hypothetical protein|uniref:hypothetical protein n=1 Tax=Maribacter aquivivus TaxID=228958 RepID=UPI00248FC92A|nr:hypothetical protein [Maribacter aquivivus]